MAVSVSTTTLLAKRALASKAAVVAINDTTTIIPRDTTQPLHHFGPAVGLRCAAAVDAIAYPIAVDMISCDPIGRDIAIVVARDGATHLVDLRHPEPKPLTAGLGSVVDMGRRALGLPTPPEPTAPIVLLDMIWFDRMLSAVLDAELGVSPPWTPLSALHPLSGQPIEPWCLRDRRLGLRFGWSAFRQQALQLNSGWPGLDRSIARWLDDGSFARWCLADLLEPSDVRRDLIELLDPAVVACIDEALSMPPRW